MNIEKKIMLILCILMMFFHKAFSQSNIQFDRISIEHGLSQSTIRCIIKDSKGFIWIGTSDGLNKYDGYGFTTYKPDVNDPNSIVNNYIICLYEDRNGAIWIGTSEGLSVFDHTTEKFKSYKSFINNSNEEYNHSVRVIKEDDAGNLWLGTDLGIIIFDKKNEKFTSITSDAKHPDKKFTYIRDILIDNEDKIWFISEGNGLFCYNPIKKIFTYFNQQPNNPFNISNNNLLCITKSRQDLFWIGSSEGLFKFNPLEGEAKLYSTTQGDEFRLSGDNIKDITEDDLGNLWITAKGIDIVNLATKTITNYRNVPSDDKSLSHNNVNTIYRDPDGIIWVGTFGGVNKYDRAKRKFKHFPPDPSNPNSLSHKYVWTFYIDKDGYLWIGTDRGIDRYDKHTGIFTNYRNIPEDNTSISHNRVWNICGGRGDIIWLGTRNGLCKFNTKTGKCKRFFHNENDPATIGGNDIRDLHMDKEDVLWIGLFGQGLDALNTKTEEIKHYKRDENDETSINQSQVWVIHEDTEGYIWTGAFEGGLNRFDRETEEFIAYTHDDNDPESIIYDNLMSIYEDSKGRLWIGTWGKGLDYFDSENNKFIHFTERDGLQNNVIYDILEDNEGNLWLSTNNGLSKFNPDKKTFRNYTEEDGLQSNEFNGGAAYKAPDGQMFFGGIYGFNTFYPSDVKDNPVIPPIVITGFHILNNEIPIGALDDGRTILSKSITETDEIVLTHVDYVFSFEFAALHYSSSKNVRYAYMIEGFEDKWNYTTEERRFASYTNLDAGQYVFRVKGTNGDGVWNENGTSIKITILPPYWETWWFRTIVILLILGIIYFVYRSRIEQVKRQKRELERQVKERTEEIRQKNAALEQQTEEIRAQRDKIEEAFDNVKLLSEIGKEITGNLSVIGIIETAYQNINALMDASVFSIGIYNPHRNSIEFHGTMEKGERLPPYVHSVDDSNRISVWCFNNQREVFINDFRKEYVRYIKSIKPPTAGESPMSIIYLPLNFKDKKIGVITVQSFQLEAYTDYHIGILRNLAVYTGIALDNASTYDALEREREHTMGSIRYAQTIQNAILPLKEHMDKLFDSFVIFRPKDIVSGDFYWFSHVRKNGYDDKVFVAVVDCTGHGVPGAFMSLIGNRLLNEIVNEKKCYDPSEILTILDHEVKKTLKQRETQNDDGMDVCLCKLEKTAENKAKITFSGAKRPLFCYKQSDGDIVTIKGVRRPIGGKYDFPVKFENSGIILESDDIMFLSSDGIIDQNNTDRKKFGTKRLIELLRKNAPFSMDEQKDSIESAFNEFVKTEPQRDDITLFAIRI